MAPVLLAECGAEERKGGKGGRGGAHPVRLSELPMKILPNHLFAPAPIKRIVDGREVMKGTRTIEHASRRTSVVMKKRTINKIKGARTTRRGKGQNDCNRKAAVKRTQQHREARPQPSS